jgi:small subunit ribosomal protein S16
MAVKIRLQRYGSKKRPFYRLVAADSRKKRDGRYLEILGTYNPVTEPATVKIDEDKARKWLSEGAQPTDTVKNLFARAGITSNKKVN